MGKIKIWKLCMLILLILMMSTAANSLYASEEPNESAEVSTSYPVISEPPDVPHGEVSSVDAVEVELVGPVFREADDGPPLRPNHPPIDQIPPMPMPEDTGDVPTSIGPGAGIYRDAVTGEMIVFPADEAPVSGGFGQGGGYTGADGGEGLEEVPMTFYDMYQITNTGDFPWRMNCKLVMRFVDLGGNNRWFVCSGTMRDAETVLTAGHCVYAREATGPDIFDWAEEIWVYPGYNGEDWGVPPPWSVGEYGWGHGTYFGSWTGWTVGGDLNYDVGLIGVTRAVGMLTGWFGWAYGGSCDWHLSTTYNNASYPAESCGIPGLHNGLDMYYWYGHFDSCPSWNRLQVNTTGGCYNAGWGGMSGSGAYFIDGDNRYVHGMASTSDRATITRYSRQWEDWVIWSNDTFIPDVRGSAFDLQALDVNAQPATIKQGESTTLLNHLATNPTNGGADDTWTFRVYLSTNDNISTADTLLSTQGYSWNFGAMSSVRVNMVMVTIPFNTPPGDYWVGLVYDSATDYNSTNNETDGWDAVLIQVTPETDPPVPNPMTWQTEPYELDPSQIRMVATTASDPTPPVEYYFDFSASPTGGSGGTDSGWQSSTTYTDSGLQPNHQYGYRVRARDGNNNLTSYSSVSYDYTDIETPSGITFGSITSISIQARSTNTPSGLTRGSSGLIIYNTTAGTNSGWKQNNSYWTSGSLSPNTQYGFRARARNGDGDTTPYSATYYRYTLANLPGAAAFSDITQTSIWANWTANGNPPGTQYFCENTTAGTNSGWTTNTSWNSTGLDCGTSYTFRVKAQNGDGEETGWTSLGSQSTLACPTTGTIYGVVTKKGTGKLLEGAKVIAKHEDGITIKKTKTDASGYYEHTDLKAGMWKLKAKKRGFRKKKAWVDVSPGGRYEQNFMLRRER
jgi:hypothetical protein